MSDEKARVRRGRRGRRGAPESWAMDAHVGERIRTRRILLGLSQAKLGEILGLTFQQVQKYEHGRNRITAGMLHQVSQALEVPISFFFDDFMVETSKPQNEQQLTQAEARFLVSLRKLPEELFIEVRRFVDSLAKREEGR